MAPEASWTADLWIGVPYWPTLSSPRVAPWEGVDLEEFQIAGLRCHHQKFFGLKFEVPRGDPLAVLVASYLGSHLPGIGNAETATPLEEIIRVRDRLTEIDLVLDPIYYASFAEAYIPISAESAWIYAVRRRLSVIVKSDVYARGEPTAPGDIGLDTEWDTAEEYLRGCWQWMEKGSASPLRRAAPEYWTAVVNFPNWD